MKLVHNHIRSLTETTSELSINQTMESAGLDKDIVNILEIFTNCIMINLICIFGIIGNSINIIVLCKHGYRESNNIILVSLSVSDLLFSFILPLTRLKCLVKHFDEGFSITLNTFVTVYLFMPKYTCLATDISYVTLIAVERFIAVFFPFQVGKIFDKKTTRIIAIAIPVFCLIVLTPTFLALTFTWTFHHGLNQTVAVIEYTQFYVVHHKFLDFYAWVGLNIFFSVSAIFIISVCCLSVGLRLSRAAVKRRALTSRSSGYDVRVVRMLVTVCIVFLAVSIPNSVLYSYYVPNFIFVSAMHELIDNICAILYAVNASANFVVYVTMSKKFASTYRTLLACTIFNSKN